MNKKGFTLMELLVIIIILGVLSAVAIPKFIESSKISKGEQGKGAGTITIFESRVVRDTIPQTFTPEEKETTRCIEGYKFIVSSNGNLHQLIDEYGRGIKCSY